MVRVETTTADLVAHLYRRAGFGASPSQLATASAAGYHATVADLVGGLSSVDSGAATIDPPTLSAPVPKRERKARGKTDRMQLRQEFVALTGWWLARMMATTTPLTEKLTFLLHGHFPTAISKVKYPSYMYEQNQLFRTRGSGDFDTLTQAVATDPAMLIWLDANSNKASNPNENFARELMERFTLGVGTYSQADVRAASYCFTGWRVDPRTGGFDIATRQHSTTPQTFLGTPEVSSGQQVIDIVTHSATSSHFVPARFWSYLAYPVTPGDQVVADLATTYAADRNIANLLAAIFTHPEFTGAKARNGLVKQPTEYVVGALRALGIAPATVAARPAVLVRTFQNLGQVLFDPPSVGGWPQNGYWLSTSAALARWEFARQLTRVGDISPVVDASSRDRVDAAAHMLGLTRWSARMATALARAANDPPTLMTLALVSPDYVGN